MVPQQILQEIPVYKSTLESDLNTTDANGVPTMTNAKIPSAGEKAFVKAINFVGGTPLPVLEATEDRDIETLKSLLAVYDVCIEFQIEALEHAILDRMTKHEYPKLKTFIDFA